MSQKKEKSKRKLVKKELAEKRNPTLIIEDTGEKIKYMDLFIAIRTEIIKAMINLLDIEEIKKTNYQELVQKLKHFLALQLKETVVYQEKEKFEKEVLCKKS